MTDSAGGWRSGLSDAAIACHKTRLIWWARFVYLVFFGFGGIGLIALSSGNGLASFSDWFWLVCCSLALIIGVWGLLTSLSNITVTVADDSISISAPLSLRRAILIREQDWVSLVVPRSAIKSPTLSGVAKGVALVAPPTRSEPCLIVTLRERRSVPWIPGFGRSLFRRASIIAVAGTEQDRQALRAVFGRLADQSQSNVPPPVFARASNLRIATLVVLAGVAWHSTVGFSVGGGSESARNARTGHLEFRSGECAARMPSPGVRTPSVPCTKSHILEILGESSIDLSDAGEVSPSCASVVSKYVGPDAIDVRGMKIFVINPSLPAGECAARFERPVRQPFRAIASQFAVLGAWAQPVGQCLTGTDPSSLRPVDCVNPHRMEVVSDQLPRATNQDIGDLCHPALDQYLAPAPPANDDQILFISRSDKPDVGRCILKVTTDKIGSRRGGG